MLKEETYLIKIAENCIDNSKKFGATDAEILVSHSVSENVNLRNKKLDGSVRSENLGINITTYLGKKKTSISNQNEN